MQGRNGGGREHWALVVAEEAFVVAVRRDVAVSRLGTVKEGGKVGRRWRGFDADDGGHILGNTVDGIGGEIGGWVIGVEAAEVGGKEEEENQFEINVGDVGEVDPGED